MGIFTVHMVRKDDNLEYIRMYRFAENRSERQALQTHSN
jgi:hypothetical protein